jgi:hypothetical protein
MPEENPDETLIAEKFQRAISGKLEKMTTPLLWPDKFSPIPVGHTLEKGSVIGVPGRQGGDRFSHYQHNGGAGKSPVQPSRGLTQNRGRAIVFGGKN